MDSANSLNQDSAEVDNVDEPTVDSPCLEGSIGGDFSECEERVLGNNEDGDEVDEQNRMWLALSVGFQIRYLTCN